jgi:murein DD-endopeptidase MepM/ murein hydrolase activator NlpD
MPGSKGIKADLTSISGLLGTILDQVDQITSKAGDAGDAVSKVVGAGSAGGTAASAIGATKRGSGTQSLGLANISAPSGGMSGAEGMKDETKFGAGSEKSSQSATNSMGGWSGTLFGGKAAGIAGAVATAVGGLANVAGDAMNMMPDVNTVMNRSASYYHAGLYGSASSSQIQASAKSNGLYRTGMDGTISDYMASMGINFGSASWNSVSRETAGAAQYLNMDPMAAAQAYTNLNSGTTSANLMRTLGISTSDAKGNSLSADQIFGQIDSRIFQPGVKYSEQDVNNNWLKGGLQQALGNMGLSSDQQELYRQHLLSKVTGKPTDMAGNKTLDQLLADQKKQGNENPLTSQYTQNASQASLYDSYQKPYLDGIKAATPLIVAMNKALEGVPDWAKKFKAEMDILAGNKGTGGAMKTGGDILGTVLGVGAGLIGGKGAQSLLSKLFGKNASKTAGKAAAKGGTAAEDAASAASKSGGATAAEDAAAARGGSLAAGSLSKLLGPTLGSTLSNVPLSDKSNPGNLPLTKKGNPKTWATDAMSDKATQSGQEYSRVEGEGWKNFGTWMTSGVGSKKSDQAWGNLIKDLSYIWGGAANGAKSPLSNGGKGSSGSTVGTASTGGGSGTISFILPVNGKITDGFGPRSASSTGGIGSTYHKGIDIAAPMGTPIHAGADGKVSAVGWDGSFGNRVMIDHAGGYQSIYAHQPSGGPTVSVGQVVKQGDLIGHVGSTGASTGPHCHFEVRLNGTAINPAPLIGAATPIKDTPPSTSQPATTQQPKPQRLGLFVTSSRSQGDIVGAVSQAMPQFASPGSGNASFGAQSTGTAGAPAQLVASNQMAKGYGTGAGGIGGGNQSSMSVPGMKYYKQGDDYVAQDSHVNVHAGEAILNQEAADEWRRSKAGGSKKEKPQVVIHLTVQDASDAEARKFANRVKSYLEEDSMDTAMGSR